MSLFSNSSPLSVTLTAGTGCSNVMLWANANIGVTLNIADNTMFFNIFIPYLSWCGMLSGNVIFSIAFVNWSVLKKINNLITFRIRDQ
ncbi:conserved exported protein of unknown function [Xenorhabdus doucetiae]|uniref:Uncharacterized protein n=1 Tax=Xenorhabdus doucetiae TaxID=351671 RepID=A0A068QN59_9GAMM|nr:conserved exported protein of unknown function [Xenorhabdus doucetiae]